METKNFMQEHKHPMMLKDDLTKDEKDKIILCYVCGELVSKFSVYFCSECNILIHTACAELPLKVTHPMHSEHELVLAYNEGPKGFYVEGATACSGCRTRLIKRYAYTCLPCKFYICVRCGFHVSNDRIFKHKCHEHPLLVVPKKAKFYCEACDVEVSGWNSYICTICPFWVHNICASSPSTVQGELHHHPLSLSYCVPLEFRHYNFFCDICNKALHPLVWVYFCAPCRFFTHIKCERKNRSTTTKHDGSGPSSSAANHEHDLIQLPWNDISVDMIRPFLEKNSQIEMHPLEEMKHFSHEHPLILSSVQIDEDILCDGCIDPISIPYYYCTQCKYLLHLNCAHLPTELQHSSHPEHRLSLKKLKHELGYFNCKSCHIRSNGFFFECETCQFKLDLYCATLPANITHKAHNEHHLVQKVALKEHSTRQCNACGKRIYGLIYHCDRHCSRFYLHYRCAIMPRAVRHKWDKHQLMLTYPPFSDHPDEFYCEVCEEEIHPKHWLYHCRECDQSFHLFCIPRLGKDPLIKFGGTLRVVNHQHLLTSVREGTYKSKCASCGKKLSGLKAFECKPCKFSLCYECGCRIPPEPLQNIVLPEQQEELGDPGQSGCAIM